MELTLKRYLEEASFSPSKRGYDRDEVDSFLDKAVAMATKVEAKLSQAIEDGRATGARGTGPSAAELEAEIERRVQARLAEERATGAPGEEEHAEEMRKTLVLAQRTADAAIREAREEADSIRADASKEAEVRRRDLEEELATTRRTSHERVRQEIAELEGARESLRTDVGVIERYVEEQRNQLRSTVGELQRLLDDPSGFRLAPAPTLVAPEAPNPAVVATTEPAPVDPSPVADAEPALVPDVESESEAEPEPEAELRHAVSQAEPVEDDDLDEPDVDPLRVPPLRALAEGAAPLFPAPSDDDGLHFGDVEHEPPLSSGPPTQPVPTTGDAFMDELRKAMSDDTPLGPRDDAPDGTSGPQDPFDDDRRGWRFGKRR